jgi:two-component system CheB/CheR fusion protein
VLDALPQAVVLTGSDAKIAAFNAAAQTLLSYSRDEAEGRPFTLLLPSDWAPEVRALHERALRGQKVEGFVTQAIAKGGRRLRVRISLGPIPDERGTVGGVAWLWVAAEAPSPTTHAGSGERLRAEIGSLRIGAWQWQLGTSSMSWSAALEEIHGLCPGSFGGTLTDFERWVHPDDRVALRADMERAAREVTGFQREYRFVKSDTTVGWLEASGRVLLDGQGRPQRLSTVCVDITAQKQAEILVHRTRGAVAQLGNELERRLEDAERANREKEQVLAVLAHELRVPLTPALSAAELLIQSKVLPEALRAEAVVIERNIRLAARLVGDLLDLSRIGRKRVDLSLQRIDVAQVIDDAVSVCASEVARKELSLELSGPRAEVFVQVDGARLEQVLWNLLMNAVKFTPQGGSIRIHWRRLDDLVEIALSDSGRGIEPELLPKVFEPFEQGAHPEGETGGLGLGLAITRALIDMHGGTITAESAGPNSGATFRISLPCAPPARRHAAPQPVKTLNVLVVEDQRDLARMLGELLGLVGHRATTANNVEDALRLCQCERFDLVVSDIELGPKLGYELVRRLRELGIDTPAIAISGRSSPDAIERSREAGFVDHLVKPVGARALLESVERFASSTSISAD